MSISQAVYEAQIQRIADLQARLADLEAERALLVTRAENAEAALDLAARTLRGEGAEDQGDAYDKAQRIIDAHLARKS